VSFSCSAIYSFYPRDAMLAHLSAIWAGVSLCPYSVCHTLVLYKNMAKLGMTQTMPHDSREMRDLCRLNLAFL